MHPYLSDMSADQLVKAFIANKAGFAARLAQMPGATLQQNAGISWVDTGIPLDVFNGVSHATVAGHEADAAIAAAIAHFRTRALPFHWSLGPLPQPDLEARLLAHGFGFEETEPAMAADLDAPQNPVPPIADFTIVPVTTPAQVAQWVQTWGTGAPDFVIGHWRTVYTALWQMLPREEFALYLGMLDNEPVGTVYYHCAAGVAAVHYVVTLPQFRRRGIGAALTQHAMHAARQLGQHIAMLTASPYGIGIYRRLGFREFGNVSSYIWEPPTAP